MSYSKAKWDYSLKAAMEMNTSPQHFQWILRGTAPGSRWGDIYRWSFKANYQVHDECIIEPSPQGGPLLHRFDGVDLKK